MDFVSLLLSDIVDQLRSPTLSFLIGGIILAALGTQLQIPESICKMLVFMLLIKIGLTGGMEIRNANLAEMAVPAAFSIILGILIVFIARYTLAKMPRVKTEDAIATGGLFGAVSGSTMAAVLALLEERDIGFEAWSAALYPFMDIPALVTAIVVANLYLNRKQRSSEMHATAEDSFSKQPVAAGGYGDGQDYPSSRQEYLSKKRGRGGNRVEVWPIIRESLQGPALSAMFLGVGLGIFALPERVYETFYDPLFRGLLSILMLVMGMEAWARLGELRKVAQWYVVYSVVMPIVHGFIGFGFGMIAHYLTGFSLGGVAVLAVIAASSSDISGPPTLRAGIPSANPSAYIGASTAIGTPVAIALCIPLFVSLAQALGAGPN